MPEVRIEEELIRGLEASPLPAKPLVYGLGLVALGTPMLGVFHDSATRLGGP